MAITYVVSEIWNRKGGVNIKWERRYTRRFQVIALGTGGPIASLGPQTAIAQACAYANISLGSAYSTSAESDLWARCTSIDAEEVNADGCQWVVTFEFGPFDIIRNTENPLDAPVKIEWGWMQFEETVDEDINGNQVVNSAGDPFDPPLVRDQSRPLVTIIKNQPTFSAALVQQYKDATNSDAFGGAGPYTWKCSNITGSQEYHPACGLYWPTKYEFAFEANGWKTEILDAGLRQLDGSGGRKAIVGSDGQPVTSPVPLDNGEPLAPNASPSYLSFQVYKVQAFGALGLNF